jgi:sugar phosphate isomerase/epimerase
MPKNVIACRPGSFASFHQEAFEHLAKIGLPNVEIGVPAEKEWPELKAKIAKFKMNVTSVAGGVDFSKAESVAAFDLLARGAKEFGAKIIFLSVKSGGKPLPECYAGLRKLGDIAKANGATIALETHPDLVTNGEVAAQTMKGTEHPNVKLNYDSANLYYYNENIDGIAELKKFMPWMGAVHLKESDGKPKSWYFPGLHEGHGIVNFPEIFKLCNAAGFYGPFTMEIEGIEGEKLTREQAVARVANSVTYLKSIGAL